MKRYDPNKSTRYKNIFKNKKKLPELYRKREYCCGCSACYSICSTNAISMEPDEEGFLYPIVDADKCIMCFKCIGVCIFKEDQENCGYYINEDSSI